MAWDPAVKPRDNDMDSPHFLNGIKTCQNEQQLSFKQKRPVIGNCTVIGLGIAKNVIYIHGEDSQGKRIVKKRITRSKRVILEDHLYLSHSQH